MRKALTVLVIALFCLQPAIANADEPERPADVGLVSFVGAGLSTNGASLSISWDRVAAAARYEIYYSTSYDLVLTQSTPQLHTETNSATITGLEPGTPYFVMVRGVSSTGARGGRSSRVGHYTITDQPTAEQQASLTEYKVLSWNVCSHVCSGIASRSKIISQRIGEIKPDVVAFQESIDYKTSMSGYRYAVANQLSIVYNNSKFVPVYLDGIRAAGFQRFAARYAVAGEGVSWSALRDRTTNRISLIMNVHLKAGTDSASVQQREYETHRLVAYISDLKARLARQYSSVASWTHTPLVILGDFNTHRLRSNDDTQTILSDAGWFDAFEQATTLSRQHQNTSNSYWSVKPVISLRWGSHVDKVLVDPSSTVVTYWQNAEKMSGGNYVAPLGSDHHPLLVKVKI